MGENGNGICEKCFSPATLKPDQDYQGEPFIVHFDAPGCKTFHVWKAPLVRGKLCYYHQKEADGLFKEKNCRGKDLFKDYCF